MNAKQIILQIALKENKPPEEIEAAMYEAMRIAMASENPKAQQLWKELAPDGKEPTLDDFLAFCTKKSNNCCNVKFFAIGKRPPLTRGLSKIFDF